jgi:hypothetical protein
MEITYKCDECEAIIKMPSLELPHKCLCGASQFVKLAELIEENERPTLEEIYKELSEKLDYYVDTSQDSKLLIKLWILASHFHNNFPTFPILYLNAMRGCGKTRLLNFISHTSLGTIGNVQNSISESALFHSAGNTLAIDEIEPKGVEKSNLNLLLNSCYKKGTKVSRMNKVKDNKKEGYEKEEHSLYMPVVLANIYGIDRVLEDRALIVVLERSFNPVITNRIEDFDRRLAGLKVKLRLLSSDTMTRMTGVTHIIDGWNDYIDSLSISNYASQVSQVSQVSLYKRIFEAGINGRTMELCFPLLITASLVSEEVFTQALNIFSSINKKRRETELDEEHIQIYRFVSTLGMQLENFETAHNLLERFKVFVGYDTRLNPTSFSMALERLQLIKERKRTGTQRLLRLDVKKASQIIGLFEGQR